MQQEKVELGRVISTYLTAPAFIQRAAIIAIVSFLFFLAMLLAFSARGQMIYLVLAAAFFVVNIFTLTGFVIQRRNEVKVFEKGIAYRGRQAEWDDLVSTEIDPTGQLNLQTRQQSKIVIPKTIANIGKLDEYIRHQIR
ncbi:MAG TPA: hypothetical protein VJ781_07805 [Pyrinomonadaceae bacterium]|nr:hypothetical protein [Pyrinomonadaceae bacterium]